ncbi:hypothetical protein LJR232_002503 [Aquipseudomonas alcaligenes]|nr:hypothetical protein [Pseudomonas solani]MDN4147442.1 hypothetical protein [Pseudomonas tohonis]
MSRSILLLVFFCSMAMAGDMLDYRQVSQAGSGVVGGKVIRYFAVFSNKCIVVQVLRPGGGAEVKIDSENSICSLDGKSFNSDFADVDLKDGAFDSGKLILEIGFTPLIPTGEQVKKCEVIFAGEVARHLVCGELQ